MSYRRLTPEEIEDLRSEMRAAGLWMRAELAKRRREHGDTNAVETSASPITNGEASRAALGEEQG
ncbi:hypothetical protein ACT3UG_04790 [Halomonas sp. AOP27-A1-34]|uniref:hypothetical protein n=1 Tax=unclassified Halomonas TaxID=2609666 RepID=UPI004034DF17